MHPSFPPLPLPPGLALTALHSGLFISRGVGAHPTRTIDSWELIFVRSGHLGIREETTRFELDPGHALILAPGREHAGIHDYPRDLSFYWLHFRLASPPRAAKPPHNRHRLRPAPCPVVPQLTRLPEPTRLTQLIHLFLDQQERRHPAHVQSALLLLILHELAATAAADPAREADPAAATAAGLRRSARVRQLIRERLTADLSTAAIARAFDCNPDHLGRAFRLATGHTVTDEIHRQRLTAAERHLIDTDDPVAAVGRAVGFADPGYFIRLFRRHTGLTPTAFRRRHARLYLNPE